MSQPECPTIDRSSVTYTDIRCRQLEGHFPGDCMMGVWPVSAARIACGWGGVLESDWPYTSSVDNWPPPEPPGLDAKAKQRRCHHYQRVRSAHDCRVLLANCLPVSASFEITDQWFDAEHGVITMPEPGDKIIGSHCVCIVGFDLANCNFIFVNSWGEKWGVNGFGFLPMAYFDKYFVSSWQPHGLGLTQDYFRGKGTTRVIWGMPDLLDYRERQRGIIHGAELFDGDNDERMGWLFMVHRNGHLDIEDLFVRPQYRKNGIGNQLVAAALEMSDNLKRPLRLWITHAESSPDAFCLVERMADKLGLVLFPPGVRWAAAVGLSQDEGEREGLSAVSANSPALVRPAAIRRYALKKESPQPRTLGNVRRNRSRPGVVFSQN